MQEFRLSAMEERNYGIDLLRIVSMMMVVLLHVLGQGGILDGSDPLTVKSETAWLLEIGAYSAVNIYAMISGYVGYGRKYKYSGLVYLYFQVLFYTVPTTIIFYIYRPELVNLKGKRELLFPFAYNTYWYFTAYFCLAFFIPFLNMMLERLDRAELKRLLFFLCLIFSILPTLFYEDFPRTSSGYSFLWLAVLYLVGGYIKKYNTTFPGKGGRKFLGYLVCILVTWLVKVGVQYHIPRGENQPILYDSLISYTSPTIVLSGVCLFLIFVNIRCGKMARKIIGYLAPASFGVYLLHEEPLMIELCMENMFVGYLILNPGQMVGAILATVLGIWIIGTLTDRIRINLFDLFGIRRLSDFLGEKIQKGVDKIR